MILKTVRAFFDFSREQRNGIFVLFGIIILLQAIYYFANFSIIPKNDPDKQRWISLQSQIDSLKTTTDWQYSKMYTFNPNFITDYKGYKLGMSVLEIDRLLAFRKSNKYVNSAQEFQNVTKVSDSLLQAIAPFFKFPEWVNQKNPPREYKKYSNQVFAKSEKISVIDINQATKEDLVKIYGVGEAISIRILKQKESLGAFVSMEQMNDIWGLTPEVIANLNTHFNVSMLPKIEKVAVNDATLKELAQFHYFRYALAKEIVTYRSMNRKINNVEDLTKIKGFPVDKAKIIALYLDFN